MKWPIFIIWDFDFIERNRHFRAVSKRFFAFSEKREMSRKHFHIERPVYRVTHAHWPTDRPAENHHLPRPPSEISSRRASSAPSRSARTASGSKARRPRGQRQGSLPVSVFAPTPYRRASELARLSLHHSARNTRAGVVPPAVFVGIGQLAGCNGAIRSAVPFRCFASRTSLRERAVAPPWLCYKFASKYQRRASPQFRNRISPCKNFPRVNCTFIIIHSDPGVNFIIYKSIRMRRSYF